ncbi:MAG TPA: PQQ-binding-like beta-propeller repeat protein [Candidatus Thermoplasmatota archaeon]|nr:PQQ-binding-like beta-propeller repeat protein [Candidatus Thermoplasmatota archaeon]
MSFARAARLPGLTLLLLLGSTGLAGADWPMGPHDLGGSRHAADSSWDAADVAALSLAWSYETDGSLTGTPTFYEGRVYVASWKGNVYALDAQDGSLVWTHDIGAQADAPVTLWDGLAFVGDGKGRLHALDARTGGPVWNVTTDTTKSAHLYATPTVVPSARGPIVVMGIASDQESVRLHGDAPLDFRGGVVAYEARTGVEVWRTTLIPEGYTGAPVWSTPIYDEGTKLLLFGTGNAYTRPAHNMSDSVVALDAETGRVVWSFQATHNDVFTQAEPHSVDDDFGSTGSLVAGHDGERLFALGQKSAIVRAFHVANGTIAWRHGNSSSPGEGIIGASAYADGLLAVPYTREKRITVFDAATGESRWSHGFTGAVYSAPAIAGGVVFVADTTGNMTAFELASGNALWSGGTAGAGIVYGGLSVASGLLLVPVVDSAFLGEHGHVLAFAPHGHAELPAPTKATPPPSPTLGSSDAIVWDMKNSDFQPQRREIVTGAEVVWRNLDPFAHVVMSGWDEGAALNAYVDVDGSARFRFETAGEYLLVCPLHATPDEKGEWAEGMLATVVVTASGEPPGSGPQESGGAAIGRGVPGVGALALVGLVSALAWALRR